MQKTEEFLVEIGLTLTEARIYLAGLPFTSVTIQDVGKKTKIKRPTIYHAISTLMEKGLVSEKRIGNKLHFSMSSPENIRGLVEEQREKIEARASTLDSLVTLLSVQKKISTDDATSVTQYDGIDGMKLVLDMAFYCKSKHWDIIAPVKNFLREYDRDYATRYLNARKHYNINARTLWEFSSGSRELDAKEIRDRNPRFMPAVMQGRFKSMMILFDDKIAVFSSYEKLSAILISSKELHTMFQSIFDALWEFSEEYK